LLLVCVALTCPRLEAGLNDDWSYIATAQRFAQTGHFFYNGWAAPILGWQVVFAAPFVRLFGFSFTVVRSSVLLIALATAFLMQRIFQRCGISPFNATVGTLAFVLSPLFLPLAFSFMSDVPALFCTLLCLYGCLRGLQSATPLKALAWMLFAALSSDIGGTGRQTAWLGALVMVPCALWLLRPRRPLTLLIAAALWLGSVAFIAATLHWYNAHLYTIPETLFPGHFYIWNLTSLGTNLLRLTLEMALLLLPLSSACLVALLLRARPLWIIAGLAGMASLVAFYRLRQTAGLQTLSPWLTQWLAPWLINTFTEHGVLDGTPIIGQRPLLLSTGTRLLLSVLTLAGLAALALLAISSPRRSTAHTASLPCPVPDLAVLLGPFAAATLLVLGPRAAFAIVFDRYLLTLLFLAFLALLRCTQPIAPRLLHAAVLPVLLMAAFSVAATHDAFAMFRARLQAVHQLLAAGVPSSAIDGGFEFNGWTQVQRSGFVSDPHLLPPAKAAQLAGYYNVPHPCQPLNAFLFPDLHARYALAYSPGLCGGDAGFAPVLYHQWLRPHTVSVYIVRVQPITVP
jgi:hypothetical protein